MTETDNSMEAGLARWCSTTPLRTIIDVGASNGMWTRVAQKYWPHADYFLIEAQAHPHEPDLRSLQSECPNVQYTIAAAGDRVGKLYFWPSDPFGGVASHGPIDHRCIEVPATTIDVETAQRGLRPPFLLKLDTHGFEVPIFKGAAATLEKTNLIVVEVYNFQLLEGCLRFHEMCAFLEARGFRCIDICDVMRRRDNVLWQCDMFFAPQTRPEFAANWYDVR